jgi:hypothetical protein
MTRRHVTFPCGGDALIGTLDEAKGDTGLLIVTGGNELRSGAWSGQARLAARKASVGFPVFRFDPRGKALERMSGQNSPVSGRAAPQQV